MTLFLDYTELVTVEKSSIPTFQEFYSELTSINAVQHNEPLQSIPYSNVQLGYSHVIPSFPFYSNAEKSG